MLRIAHSLKERTRTDDVVITENVDFSSLLLSKSVSQGLTNSGFLKPSPIQLKAIPLGRCGLDLIVQAKSGTGKTCVFSVIALETIQIDSPSTQVLVLAPTREIAVQIWEVIGGIGSAMQGLKCHTFIGGLPLQEDRMKLKKSHIAVGTPGRVKQLIETGVLKTESVRLFVLDEADKLLEESFQDQINWIYSALPENKQMLALSATYPEYLADHLTAYMRNPTFLRLNISDPALLGIRQFYKTVPYHPMSHVVFEEKSKALTTILSSVSFQQCLVFSNLQTRAQNLADSLNHKGWPTACIAGCLDQKDRNHAMAKLKTYKCRILISTDLTARGIDADKVNVIVNLDVPKDHETYLHRIGRAGRFGSFGIAVTLVSDGQERMDLTAIEKRCNTHINPLPDPIPEDLAHAAAPIHLNDVVSSEVINTDKYVKGLTRTKNSSHSDMTQDKDKEKHISLTKTHTEEQSLKQQTEHYENQTKEVFKDKHDLEGKVKTDVNNSNSNQYANENESGILNELNNDTGAKHPLVNGDNTEHDKQATVSDLDNQSDNVQNLANVSENSSTVNVKAVESECSETRSEAFHAIRENSESQNKSGGNTDTLKQSHNDFTEVNSEMNGYIDSTSDVNEEVSEPDLQPESSRTTDPLKVSLIPSAQINSPHLQISSVPKLNNTDFHIENRKTRTKEAKQTVKEDCLKSNTYHHESAYGSKQHSKDLTNNNKQADKGKLEYETPLASFIPPKIDVVSLFKQSVGHKPARTQYTYDSAKSKMLLYKPDMSQNSDNETKHAFNQKTCRNAEFDALLSAVHELQIRFDKTKQVPMYASSQNASSVIDSTQDKIQVSSISTTSLEPVFALQDERSENSKQPNVNTSAENVSILNAERNKEHLKEKPAMYKKRKTNRIGYAGKFAIAHMLDQSDSKNDVRNHENIDKSAIDKQNEKSDDGENCDQGEELTTIKLPESNEDSSKLLKVEQSDVGHYDADLYNELVLESAAVEKLLQKTTEAESSDEIVTEDSDTDSNSSEETDTADEECVQNYPAPLMSSAHKHMQHLGKSNDSAKERNVRNNHKPESLQNPEKASLYSRRKQTSEKISRLENEEEENFEENYANTSYYDHGRHVNHLQHYSNSTGYPYNFSQWYPITEKEKGGWAVPATYACYSGSPYQVYPTISQQFYPTNFSNHWCPPGALPFQNYHMHYQQLKNYTLPSPYWPYCMPYHSKNRSQQGETLPWSEDEENIKQAFDHQTDYIKLMCKTRETQTHRKSRSKKKHKESAET